MKQPAKPKQFWSMLKDTLKEFGEDRALRLAAALAYYAVFSLGPLLVLIVGLAGLVFGQDAVRQQVSQQLASVLGKSSADMVNSMMSASHKSGSLLATVIGGIGLLFGASGVFGQLQDALNTIWEVKSKPGQGVWGFIRQRFLSMSMVLGVGFLLLLSMVLTTMLTMFGNYVGGMASFSGPLLQALNLVVSFAVITLLFAAIFKVLPDVEIQWKDVWVGAMGTALLYTAGKYLLALYLHREGTTSAFGAASAFVIVLMYVYYSSLILFLGAEFTQVYAKAHGSVIRPSAHAEPVSSEERVQQGEPRSKSKDTRGPRQVPRRPAFAYQGGSVAIEGESEEGEMITGRYSQTIPRPHYAPLERIRARPWSFVVLAAGVGLTGALLLRYKLVRKGVKVAFALSRLW